MIKSHETGYPWLFVILSISQNLSFEPKLGVIISLEGALRYL